MLCLRFALALTIVLLFELMAGYPAFCADEPIKVYALVLKAQPAVPRSFGRRARELLDRLLTS